MTPYQRYLAGGILPLKPIEARVVKKNSIRYTPIDENLFRHGFTHPTLICVSGAVHMHYGRTSRRDMRESHRWLSSLIEGCSHRILLANHEGRLHEVCTMVQAVPATC